MSFLDEIVKGKIDKPRKTMLYGEDSTGKVLLASRADKPLFLATNKNNSDLECERLFIKDFPHMMETLKNFYVENKKTFKTIVISTLTSLDRMIAEDVVINYNKSIKDKPNKEEVNSFQKIPVGNGWGDLKKSWLRFTNAIDTIIDQDIKIVMIADGGLHKIDSPNPDVSRHEVIAPSVLRTVYEEILEGWCDEVLYFSYEFFIKEGKTMFDKDKYTGSGNVVIMTQKRPFQQAKNGLGLEYKIRFDKKNCEPLLKALRLK